MTGSGLLLVVKDAGRRRDRRPYSGPHKVKRVKATLREREGGWEGEREAKPGMGPAGGLRILGCHPRWMAWMARLPRKSMSDRACKNTLADFTPFFPGLGVWGAGTWKASCGMQPR